jgi:hypothetical protein
MEATVGERRYSQKALIALTFASATAAALAGIIAYVFVMRRLSGNPEEILNRCQDAINRLERDISFAAR